MATARETALKTLYDIEFEGAYSNLALKKNLKKSDLSTQDKAFVTQTVYGTVSMKRALDAIISAYSSVRIKKLSKYVLLILRMGVYQLKYMDKVPNSAAVNESVKLASKYAAKSKGFVNGVLRSASKGEVKFRSAAEELSYPDWLYDKWCRELGEEKAEKVMKAQLLSPQMTIRANSLKIQRDELIKELEKDGIKAKEDSLCESAVKISGLDTAASKLFAEGFFTVQDTGAQMIAKLLNPTPKSRVLDLCAAPGGKTTHMAEIMENDGEISAFDIHEHKIKLIEENAKRLGVSVIKAEMKDAAVYDSELKEKFDYVLADVPCSGLGIINRKPDIKWSADLNRELYEIQKRILDNGAEYVKKGGTVVYATCTLNKYENEYRIEEFLKEHEDFALCEDEEITKGKGYITLYPDEYDTDGFFMCKMKKIK